MWNVGDIIAVIALILSAQAAWRIFRIKRRHKELLEIQSKLNDLLLRNEKDKAAKNF